jgi:hypothetical protein
MLVFYLLWGLIFDRLEPATTVKAGGQADAATPDEDENTVPPVVDTTDPTRKSSSVR